MRQRDDEAWYRLKDAVKAARGRMCEYCGLRWGDQLHHRHYYRRGCERPEDVMLVCDLCHRAISEKLPWGRTIRVAEGSLANLGDTGRDPGGIPGELWLAYLESRLRLAAQGAT